MTRKSKKYQLLIITLLLCFLQVAGIDVYAQEPVTPVQKDSIIQSREAPKARARRHRDPAQVMDSLKKDSIKILHPERLQATDSLSAVKIQIADSLDAANKKRTEEDRTAGTYCSENRHSTSCAGSQQETVHSQPDQSNMACSRIPWRRTDLQP